MRRLHPPFLPRFPHSLAWLLAACAIPLLTSCGTTHMNGSRTAAGASVPPFRKIMVGAVDDRPTMRAEFEADLVHRLEQRKVTAAPSPDPFALEDLGKGPALIVERCAAARTDALLLVHTKDRASFERGPDYELAVGAGVIETVVRLEATLYRASDGLPVWQGVASTTFKERYDSRAVLERVAKAIVGGLAKDKVIP